MRIVLASIAIMLACVLAGLAYGDFALSVADLLRALFRSPDAPPQALMIVWSIRLPRVLLAVLVGMALAVAGAIAQAVLRNPLADPGIIGINSGAALAAMVVLVGLDDVSPAILPVAGFAGASAMVAAIFLLSWNNGTSSLRLLLIGIGLGALASLVANRYFDAVQTDAVGTGAVAAGTGGLGTDAGFELLPFFMAMRAVVRAHVTATMARDGGADAHHHIAAARSYFQVAGDLLAPQPARIVAIGGFSGSGKSTLAEALAPRIGAPPGARCIESDRTRKAMFGVAASTRLGQDAYRAEVSREVYDRLEARASALAEAGASVVVNAVYDRADRRQRLGAAAAAAGVPFDGFWLAADPDALRRRVRERVGGPSDATLEVLEAQLSGDIDEMTWQTMPADGPLETTLEAILAATRPE